MFVVDLCNDNNEAVMRAAWSLGVSELAKLGGLDWRGKEDCLFGVDMSERVGEVF